MPDLLFEIGSEEIPAGYIVPAMEAMRKDFQTALEKNRLTAANVHVTGTPIRLVLHASGLPEQQESMDLEVSGPPKRVAFDDDGNPTKAAEGFARKQGLDVSAIELRETPRGEFCFAIKHVEGRQTQEILSEVLPELMRGIPFPKSMRWNDPKERFARPVRTILAVFGSSPVAFEYNGVQSGTESRGHRFLSPESFQVESASYPGFVDALRKRKVILELEERKSLIKKQIVQLLESAGSKHDQHGLVDEVTNLVEWPFSLVGSFEEEFLEVPPEVIVTAMTEHQRYFPMWDASGKLLNRFVVVSNRGEEQAEMVREGNERVLRARLADARFFWDEDRKTSLEERVEGLKEVLYQEKLGSYYDRTQRLCATARFIVEQLGLPGKTARDLERAARLCKADLLTNMVYEFPSLQGVMGREYALCDGEDQEVAVAIEEHYRPRQAAGELPESNLGGLLALAEKAATVSACFAAGLSPTANQDPYGLRRQTLGIIRLVVEKEIGISLSSLFQHGLELLPGSLDVSLTVIDEILGFVRERLYHFSIERGYRYDLVNSVLSSGFDDLQDFQLRLEAVTRLAEWEEWPSLVEVVERTFNITKGKTVEGVLRDDLLQEEAEKMVFEAIQKNAEVVASHFAQGDYYEGALLYHQVFAEAVHEFFDKVFVNVDEEDVRNNRLLMMASVHRLFAGQLANLVEVVVSKEVVVSN